MTREVIVTLPDSVTINGAKDAPPSLRVVKTDKWESDFIVAACTHAMSQKIGDPWSNKKNPKRGDAVRSVWEAMNAGEWSQRAQGVSESKLAEKIASIDVETLFSMLTPAQLAALKAK